MVAVDIGSIHIYFFQNLNYQCRRHRLVKKHVKIGEKHLKLKLRGQNIFDFSQNLKKVVNELYFRFFEEKKLKNVISRGKNRRRR